MPLGPGILEVSSNFQLTIRRRLKTTAIQFKGWIDTSTLTCDISVYYKFPIFPAIYLGKLQGDLKEGVTLSVDIDVFKGRLRLYIKERALWVDYAVNILGNKFEGSTKLIPLPFVAAEPKAW